MRPATLYKLETGGTGWCYEIGELDNRTTHCDLSAGDEDQAQFSPVHHVEF